MTVPGVRAAGRRSDDVQQGRGVLPGFGDPGKGEGEARTGDRQQDPRAPVDAPVGAGHEGRGQFVGGHDESRVGAAQALEQGLVGPPGSPKAAPALQRLSASAIASAASLPAKLLMI